MQRLDHLNAVLIGPASFGRTVSRELMTPAFPRTSGPRGTPVQGGVHREETAHVWEISGRASDVASPKRDVVVRATRGGASRPLVPVRVWPVSAYAQRHPTGPRAEPGAVRGAELPPVIHR